MTHHDFPELREPSSACEHLGTPGCHMQSLRHRRDHYQAHTFKRLLQASTINPDLATRQVFNRAQLQRISNMVRKVKTRRSHNRGSRLGSSREDRSQRS